MNLQKTLLQLKAERGLTTDALCELSGIPKGTLNKLLNGETRNPTSQTLRRLAEALNCPLERLCTPPSEIPGVFRLNSLSNADDILPVHRKKIPLLGTIAAGQPILCEEELEVTLCDDAVHCDFALRVKGDSMVGARIFDGDIVFIRSQPDVDDGKIAAVVIDDHATLKRLYHIPNGVQLVSENSKYPPMLFTYPECENIRVLGQAIAFTSAVR